MWNPITELTAGEFLLFYAILIAATALLCRWWSCLSDPTNPIPVPAVPSTPDHYEIAYLRGAEGEVMKVVIAGLYQRRYLCLDEAAGKTFQQASGPPARGQGVWKPPRRNGLGPKKIFVQRIARNHQLSDARYNLTVMVGRTISHYKILSELGRGGRVSSTGPKT